MKRLLLLIALLLIVIFLNGCDKRAKDSPIETINYYSPYSYIDTLVSLSFLGVTLGEDINVTKQKLNIAYTTTATDDVARQYTGKKTLLLSGISVPVSMEYYTVNDTVCMIIGTLTNDRISKDLFETYSAKYRESTIGLLLEEFEPYNTGNSISWDFKNQSVSLSRRVEKKWNLNTRPFSEYYQYQNTTITYTDYRLENRYEAIRDKQRDFDRQKQHILDSIKAEEEIKAKEIERNKRLKDAHQI